MSYGNKCTSYWFDEFKPTEVMCLSLINKGMKWHKRNKIFEDCYGVFWPEEIVFAVVDKLIHQAFCSRVEEFARPRSEIFKELLMPTSSLIDTVTHLSLENLGSLTKE